MKLFRLAAFAAFLLTTPASSAEPFRYLDPVGVNYARRPNADEFARIFPPAAVNQGVSGRALALCRVTAGGELAGCRVVAETPENYGFGKAALAAAALFKLKTTGKTETVIANQ